MRPRGSRAWCHALPRMRAFSLPASPLPVCSRMGRASRPRRASPGVIGALGRGWSAERSQGERGIPRTRSGEDMPRKPLDGVERHTCPRGKRPPVSLPHGECGVAGGAAPLPAIGFWGCRPAALFFQKGRRGLGNRCRHRSGQRPGQGGSRPDAQRACERRALRRSTRLYAVKGSVLPFISKEAIV